MTLGRSTVLDTAAGRRGAVIAGAELLGLSALVIAQPIFDALQRSTWAFSADGVWGFDVVLLGGALVLLPPALMLAIELAAGLVSRSLRGWIHLVWIGLLVALLCWQATAEEGDASRIAEAAVLAAGLLGAALYLRFEAPRLLLRVLALAAPVVLGLFLFTAPIKDFVLAADPDVPEARIDSETPVVVIIFDELPLAALLNRQGRIDAERFPNFAVLARESDWYRKALTVADSTEQAVPAILSGDFPAPNGVANYADHPGNLFTLLAPAYQMNIAETATDLCPPSICARRGSLTRRFATVLRVGIATADSFPMGLSARVALQLDDWFPPPDTNDHVERFLAGIKAPPGRGSLNFVHVELPHVPWQYMPAGRRYPTEVPPLGTSEEQWSESAGYVISGLQRLTLQLEYTDRVLGRIVARLRRVGLYDRSLLAVVADHGASFIPGHSRRLIDPVNAGAILRIPLFVKRPGQRRGQTVRRPVRTIDLLPTIADVLGIRIPWQIDGRSLLGPPSRRGANTYMKYPASVVPISPATLAKGFSVALAQRNAVVGRGNVFTLGVSRRELRSQLRSARNLEVVLENPGGTTFDPGADTVPSLVYGPILDPPAQEPERLIATLNGRIVAVAQSVEAGTRFIALIPPAAFRPGANRFALYAP